MSWQSRGNLPCRTLVYAPGCSSTNLAQPCGNDGSRSGSARHPGDLSRRRSRVRVPSLPLKKALETGPFLLQRLLSDRRDDSALARIGKVTQFTTRPATFVRVRGHTGAGAGINRPPSTGVGKRARSGVPLRVAGTPHDRACPACASKLKVGLSRPRYESVCDMDVTQIRMSAILLGSAASRQVWGKLGSSLMRLGLEAVPVPRPRGCYRR
jgi:hypothetical protein